MVQSTAKLRQEIMALSGVDIMEADGQTFKSTYAILDELALKWKDLSDIQQATITELIAGKRQGNIISSLMNNFETARQALDTSLKSSGSAMKEHEKWQQSLEARINSLKASWQSLSQSFMNSAFLKGTIDILSTLVDVIDFIIDRFGVLGTTVGGIGLFKIFKNKIDWTGVLDTFSLGKEWIHNIISSTDTLGNKFKNLGRMAKTTGKDMKQAFAGTAKELAKVIVIMNTIRAVQDIISWVSELGEETETTAEKFDRISEELSGVDSELSGLESELSSVESQIDTLLEKDELTFADEEELARLKKVSSELERQIQLAETLQESLQKSLSSTAINAYGDYAKNTSFYSSQSKQDRKEEAKAMGSSIGNIAGLIIGGVIGGFAGGNVMLGAAIGSTIGSMGGSGIGGAISDSSYANEVTVGEMLDKMHIERIKLENAQKEAYETYTDNRSNKNKKSWEEATTALNDYNAALANHITQLSEYYNSIDYASLATNKQREEYQKMGDDLDKYNIEMGVKGAKSTAFDRIFSEELITEEAKELKQAVEAAINSGEDIHFYDFDSDQFVEMKERLADMGLTITDVISYFEDLKEAQIEASDYETYDMVSNIAALSDGVAKLTDAFREFNEQGIVSTQTLIELNELFGNSGDAWKDYVDVMTSGISSIEDARNATEQLAEAHLNSIFSDGGIKFNKFNKKTDRYEFDKDNYLTYLSTINELEYLGVENAKEYTDALQQQSMMREAVAQMRADAAEKEELLSKKTLKEKEKTRLAELESKNIDDYILDIESAYGIRLENTSLLGKQYNLEDYRSKAKEYDKYLSDVEGSLDSYYSSQEKEEKLFEEYLKYVDDFNDLYDKGYHNSGVSWEEVGSAFGEVFTFGAAHTKYDETEEAYDDMVAANDAIKKEVEHRQELFDEMIDIAEKANIDLSDIDIVNFDPHDFGENSIFNQVHERVTSELKETNWGELADQLESEIEAELNNLGLEIDFGRYFDKIIIDSFNTKVGQINTARTEMFSSGGLSTDSIMAVDEIFGDLSSYDSSKLFENTANGVRLNTEEFRKLNDEFKRTNIDGLEGKMSELGDQYIKTREELYNLTYGTDEYNAKLRELTDIEKQMAANEELLSQYKGVFSAFQEWQRAESAGTERGMYETILGGFETVGDEISRGWVDDGTREFLELLKGDKATIKVDGVAKDKDIDLATASAKELQQVWKDLDKNIEHTSYSVRDFFTVDDEGNSTSQGVYNFLDAIGQMEEEAFGGKDVVKRKDGNIIGFDFQVVGGDKAIAEALGISEELVQIMKRAAIDAGFVVNFDGSYESLDVLREKAEAAAKTMNEKLKEAGKATIDIDMNADSVEDIQSQLDKIMETFGEKDGNGKLTGAINMDIKGADEAIQIASTLQSMMDKLTRPAYMDIQISQVDEKLRVPLQNLQDYRTKIEQLNQQKLRGADTTELEASIEESKEKIIADLIEIQESNPKLAAELEIDGLTKEEIEKKVETGEIKIPATVDIQLEMAESLDILALTALKENGLISDEEYVKRVNVYLEGQVDSSDVEDKVDNAVKDEEDKKSVIEKVVEVTALPIMSNAVTNIANIIGEYTDEEQEIVLKFLADPSDVENYSAEDKEAVVKFIADSIDVDGYTPEEKEAYARYIADGGDVDAYTPEEKKAIAKYLADTGEPDSYTPEEKQAIAKFLKDSGEVDSYTPAQKQAIAKFIRDSLDVDNYQMPTNKWAYAKYLKDTYDIDIWTPPLKTGGIAEYSPSIIDTTPPTLYGGTAWYNALIQGDSPVNGTANVNGTAFANGTAFKQGNWGTKGSGVALMGELGRETIVRDGRFFTVGDNGAGFYRYKKGDVIFNHKQTEELFKNGKVTSDGGRARAYVSGTAFNEGNYQWDGYGGFVLPEKPSFKIGYDYKASSDSDSKKSQEIFDWIEIAIERIEREIDNLDKKASNVYKSWSSRNNALAEQIDKVGNEIALQQKAYDAYIHAANEIGLSSEWKKKVQSGAIDIDNITDETLAEKIKDYQKYYEQALDCKDAILELQEAESALYAQRFENIQTQYDGILQGYEHTEAMLNEYISQAEEQGYIVSKKYYQALIDNEKSNIAELKKEQADLIAERDNAVAEGKITKGSEAWYEQCAAIDEVTQAIEEANTSIIEYNNSIRDIDWQVFDLIQERISNVAAEADFLIELMSNKKLFNDDGKLTSQGLATMALHSQNYNTHMYAADEYGAEVAKLDKQIAADPYDQELINRRNEVLELQRESILAAENEKNAIRDMVEEGINLELDALQERIDKYNESIDAAKDLYKYQNDVQEQSEEIASLEKQRAAYLGNDSEEGKAKLQEIEVSLKEAKENLQETEYERYISDQQELLDTLYNEYELILNTRLDNIDYLLESVIESINAAASADGAIATALGSEGAISIAIGNNATSIKDTLTSEANKVGTTLSSAMNSIWSVGEGNAKSVLTMYGEDFRTKSTTIITTLNGIKTSVNSMVASLNKEAEKKTTANKTTTSAKKNPTKTSSSSSSSSSSSNKSSGGDGKPRVGDRVKFISGQYYYDSQGRKPLGSKNQGKYVYITNTNNRGWATHGYHISTGTKLGNGDLGWVKLNQISGYSVGKKDFLSDEVAWTQEGRKREFIVRPSDGAILTPIAKGDSVLNAMASNNIWDMANSPAEFIKDNLGIGSANVPNNSNVNNNITQHFENITFSMPNVHGYNDLLREMQSDPKFEKLILSMTIDQIAGKSKLGKGKSIRN